MLLAGAVLLAVLLAGESSRAMLASARTLVFVAGIIVLLILTAVTRQQSYTDLSRAAQLRCPVLTATGL